MRSPTLHILKTDLSIYIYTYHTNEIDLFGTIELQSVPINVLEEYNLTSMTLEYRRECRQSNMLDSLTSMAKRGNQDPIISTSEKDLECTHLLRMQADKAEIVRARSVWLSKQKHNVWSQVYVSYTYNSVDVFFFFFGLIFNYFEIDCCTFQYMN